MVRTFEQRRAQCGRLFRRMTTAKSVTIMQDSHAREVHAGLRERTLAVDVRQRSDMLRKRVNRLVPGFGWGSERTAGA